MSPVVGVIRSRIMNQKKHYEKVAFMDDLKSLFESYGIPYKVRDL
jgi:hypothetical protein